MRMQYFVMIIGHYMQSYKVTENKDSLKDKLKQSI